MHGGGDAYGENDARFRIEEGQSVTFRDSALRDYYTASLPRPDAFDEFIAQRDQRWDGARSRQYVSEDVIGYQDLDDNGDWSDVPEYGHVWYPTTVAVGWTPYHYGHWGWVGAYGWTWIDDAPWGFAPFHYGRWAYIGSRWGWCPSDRRAPVHAPALVAFIGGGGVAIGVGGPVGWFPLGPRDVWFPGYHTSHAYFTNINISNTIVERGTLDGYYGHYRRGDINYGEINYHNRTIAGAVVAVPAAAFIGARSVHTSAIAVNRETFANARVSSFAAVAPTRASLVASTGRASAVPPAAVLNRRIVAASAPPAPVASFATREALLKKNPGQPLNNAQLRSLPAVQTGARDVKVNERNNVKVVTNNGVPAHTTAAPLVARPAGNGAVVNSLQNNNAGANGAQNKGLKAEDRRGAGNAVDTSHGAGNAAANGNGKRAVGGAQDEHLQSSRFVHGNNSSTGQGNNAQNANGKGAGTGQVNDRGRAVGNEIKQPGNSVPSTNGGQQATNDAMKGGGQPSNNGAQGNGRNTGQDRKVKSNQSEPVNGNASGNGQGQNQSNAQHSNSREYRAPQGSQNTGDAAQAQSYHAPVQGAQGNNDRQVKQQQLHVQQQQQQIQQQQQQQQVQHVPQPQQVQQQRALRAAGATAAQQPEQGSQRQEKEGR